MRKKILLFLLCLSPAFLQAQNFEEVLKAVATDRSAAAELGTSVAIAGNYALVGAVGESLDATGNNEEDEAGAAYLFERDDSGTWAQVQKLVADDRREEAAFGMSVALSGNYAFVGAGGESRDAEGNNPVEEAGAVYAFERNSSGTWSQIQKLVATTRHQEAEFGSSLAVSGNYLLIGAAGESLDVNDSNPLTEAGAAYLFERNESGVWTQVQKVVAAHRELEAEFGSSVALFDQYALVGAGGDRRDTSGNASLVEAGAAYLFERDSSGNWTQSQKLVAADRAAEAEFGVSVALSSDYALIGAAGESRDANGNNPEDEAGAAYLFERGDDGTWMQVQKIAGHRPRGGRRIWNIGVPIRQLSPCGRTGRRRRCNGRQFFFRCRLCLSFRAQYGWCLDASAENCGFPTGRQ